jgi:iron uptake system component EfeO
MTKKGLFAVVLTGVGVGCADPRTVVVNDVKDYVGSELSALATSVTNLGAAAPAADADGWNRTDDTSSVDNMKQAWREGRAHYERIEGAIAVIFPNYDESYDQRYDGFAAQATDVNLFDGDGVTGNKAVERILWSDAVPQSVLNFEQALSGYVAPAFPADEAQANDYKGSLVARAASDTAAMRDEFEPLSLELETAYRGVLGSIEEQLEKVNLAGTGEDESRYAQHTLADMRFNLEGGRAILGKFTPMFDAAGSDGAAVRARIEEGFARVDAAYSAISGDAIPAVPDDFDPAAPGTSDYGVLFALLQQETDLSNDASLAAAINDGAGRLGLPELAP